MRKMKKWVAEFYHHLVLLINNEQLIFINIEQRKCFFVTNICSLIDLHWRRSIQRYIIVHLLLKRRIAAKNQ